MNTWEDDLLGPGYLQMTIPLDPDEEGDVVTTLVKYVPELDPAGPPPPGDPTFVFLALHGWNDYFYQRELAHRIALAGGVFYAVDLRKYGRSLREWQTFGFIRDLRDYDDELHACFDVIFAEHGYAIPALLYGHSTGGLIASLWAHRHPGALAGLILNTPWLEFQASTMLRQLGTPIIDVLARTSPKSVIPVTDAGYYQRVLTAGLAPGTDAIPGIPAGTDDPFWTTGWEPDPRLRVSPSWPVRAAWLSAILSGHARVAEGLDIVCPVLVLTSNRSNFAAEWSEDYRETDGVLDVAQIWKRVPELGSHVTLIKLDKAIHDVILSRREVRDKAFEEIEDFIAAYALRVETQG